MQKRLFGLENEYGLMLVPYREDCGYPMESIPWCILKEFPASGYEYLYLGSQKQYYWLANGMTFYVDTGNHLEGATAECSSLRDLVAQDKAQEIILRKLTGIFEDDLREQGKNMEIIFYKNNVGRNKIDGYTPASSEISWGCHESYLVDSRIYAPGFTARVEEYLMPFFVTRQIFAGSGHILKENSEFLYVISQRAKHINRDVGNVTTIDRAIINTRDLYDTPVLENSRYSRFHLIIGDTNISQFATFLKVGTMSLAFRSVEEGKFIPQWLVLADPVKSLKELSRDTTLKNPLALVNGRSIAAIEIQREYLKIAKTLSPLSGEEREVIDYWEDVLNKLDEDPMLLKGELDWVTKKYYVEDRMRRMDLGLGDPHVLELDLKYHSLSMSAQKSLYAVLEKHGKLRRMVNDEDARRACVEPPLTKAKIRADFIKLARQKGADPSKIILDWHVAFYSCSPQGSFLYFEHRIDLGNQDPFATENNSLAEFEELLRKAA